MIDLKPIVAVILPVYFNDSLDFFKQSFFSLREQTYDNIQILIGVDGPVNNDLNRFLKQIGEEEDVHIFFFNENRGLTSVLNDLIKTALDKSIHFIARMDSDDICELNRIENQMRFLLNNTDVDVVGGYVLQFETDNPNFKKIVKYPLGNSECYRFFKYRNPLAHPAVLFRDTYFHKVSKLYREKHQKNQDTFLWLDGFLSGCVFANIDAIVLKFRTSKDFYLRRRGGYRLAVKLLHDRLEVNRELKYGLFANIFAFIFFILNLSPVFIKRFFYKIR